ncbi:hypothetical protein H0H81_004789 [Sphagnurus paluster]|uniref:Uncharacterized protein n=1 Tax=Sphagnurus paluster TaxID=117069 RepID=A0A9P7GLT4_9AGAR|nr:hypothetical protein H0H81_004789 [Sphagnurus paluster]
MAGTMMYEVQPVLNIATAKEDDRKDERIRQLECELFAIRGQKEVADGVDVPRQQPIAGPSKQSAPQAPKAAPQQLPVQEKEPEPRLTTQEKGKAKAGPTNEDFTLAPLFLRDSQGLSVDSL